MVLSLQAPNIVNVVWGWEKGYNRDQYVSRIKLPSIIIEVYRFTGPAKSLDIRLPSHHLYSHRLYSPNGFCAVCFFSPDSPPPWEVAPFTVSPAPLVVSLTVLVKPVVVSPTVCPRPLTTSSGQLRHFEEDVRIRICEGWNLTSFARCVGYAADSLAEGVCNATKNALSVNQLRAM